MTEMMKMDEEVKLENVAISVDPDPKDNPKKSTKRVRPKLTHKKRKFLSPIELHIDQRDAQIFGILEEILRDQKRLFVSIMCTLLLFIVYQIFELYSLR